MRELAEREGYDLAECTAYSDSHTDLPFLEAVGHPVVVNPDRALRRIAAERGWPVLEFSDALPAAAARPPARRGRRGGSRSRSPRGLVDADEGLGRLRALGFGEDDAQALWEHFDARRAAAGSSGTATRGSRGSRTHDGLRPVGRAATARGRVDGFERWDGSGAIGYLVLGRLVRAQLESPPERARLIVCERTFPTGMLGHYVRRLAEGGLVGAAHGDVPGRGSARRGGPKVAGTNPLAIGDPELGRRAARRRRLDGSRHVGRRHRGAPFRRTSSSRSAASSGTRRSRSRSGYRRSSTRCTASQGHGAVMLVAQPEADPVPAAATGFGSGGGSSDGRVATFVTVNATLYLRRASRRVTRGHCGKRGSSRIEAKSSSSRRARRSRAAPRTRSRRSSSARSAFPARASTQARW